MKIHVVNVAMPIEDAADACVQYNQGSVAVLASEEPKAPVVCPRCAARGKTWHGDDPKCAFVHGGVFSHDNWNCATMNDLRDRFDKNVVYSNDQSAVVIPGVGSIDHIVLTWYKQRGRVDEALQLPGAQILTLKQAEAILAAVGK